MGRAGTEFETIERGNGQSKKRAIRLAESLLDDLTRIHRAFAAAACAAAATKKFNQFVERGLMLGFGFPQKLQKAT